MTLTDTFISKAPPLRIDNAGAIRIGDSRVTLPVLLSEYKLGASPEEIAEAYDTVGLANIYAVISYYLENREKVDEYLAEYEREADELRVKIESDPRHIQLAEKIRLLRSETREPAK